ncbi:MAG: endo-1,4-beta-xylanase [Oscillospiraceae bacterium]|nr:endo-1,4-beta-xylanase [Oscillospiraceae bacterium]
MKKARFFGLCMAAVMSITAMPTAVSAANVGDKLTVESGRRTQERGNCDGYSYEVWIDNTGGSGSMTLGTGGAFKTEWSATMSRGNFLARRGMAYDTGKKATSYDTIVLNYDAEYTASSQGNSRLCVYGWYRDPLVEYYIIEDWKNWCPSKDTANKKDSKIVTIDGAQYEIFWMYHSGPDINGGNSTFKQYYSVRQNTRTSGSITVTDHFKAWENAGWGIGSLYEIALNVEGWESSGSANVSKLTMTNTPITNPGTDPDPQPTQDDVKYTAPTGSGSGISDDFEGSGTDWTTRGDGLKYGFTDALAHGGKQSLYVTGRTDYWNGFSASGSELKAGGSYSIEAYTAYKNDNASSKDFTLGVQYNVGADTTYDNLVTESASSGKWAKLASDFTIPSGATDIQLYVQCGKENESGLVPFFLDDVKLTAKSSSSEPDPDEPDDPTPGPSTGSGHQNNDYTYDANGDGFKDKMGPYFRLGTCVNQWDITKPDVQAFIKKNFNSITCENELKPSEICDQSNSHDDNIAINLSKAAPILKFCEENGIGMRGHTFVWYSQTPEWIFKENFNNNGAYVSPDRMNKRLESMIKNTFEAIKKQYPNLKLYAYDVCNELFVNNGGGMRPAGSPQNGGSYWVQCYGDDSFVINAFKYARQYAPEGCKLYLNDYNEYIEAKRDDLYNMAKKIMAAGDYIDGIGMQSHLAANYPSASLYKQAVEKFISLGLDVQITELDITQHNDPTAQAQLYQDVFKIAMTNADKISALTLWGWCDSASWRKNEDGGSPLPFDSDKNPKSYYSNIIGLTDTIKAPVQEVEETTTTTEATTTTTTTTTTKTDKATLLGDVDCNGDVDVSDVVLLARLLVEDGDAVVTETGKLNADANHNGKPDMEDGTLILQHIAKIKVFS